MASTLPNTADARLPERSEKPAKAGLRNPENPYRVIGEAIAITQKLSRLAPKEFAAKVGRDERQVARWMTAEERPQIETVFAVVEFQLLVVQAFAELAKPARPEAIDLVTEIRIRRMR